jgi:hypothetical protein
MRAIDSVRSSVVALAIALTLLARVTDVLAQVPDMVSRTTHPLDVRGDGPGYQVGFFQVQYKFAICSGQVHFTYRLNDFGLRQVGFYRFENRQFVNRRPMADPHISLQAYVTLGAVLSDAPPFEEFARKRHPVVNHRVTPDQQLGDCKGIQSKPIGSVVEFLGSGHVENAEWLINNLMASTTAPTRNIRDFAFEAELSAAKEAQGRKTVGSADLPVPGRAEEEARQQEEEKESAEEARQQQEEKESAEEARLKAALEAKRRKKLEEQAALEKAFEDARRARGENVALSNVTCDPACLKDPQDTRPPAAPPAASVPAKKTPDEAMAEALETSRYAKLKVDPCAGTNCAAGSGSPAATTAAPTTATNVVTSGSLRCAGPGMTVLAARDVSGIGDPTAACTALSLAGHPDIKVHGLYEENFGGQLGRRTVLNADGSCTWDVESRGDAAGRCRWGIKVNPNGTPAVEEVVNGIEIHLLFIEHQNPELNVAWPFAVKRDQRLLLLDTRQRVF